MGELVREEVLEVEAEAPSVTLEVGVEVGELVRVLVELVDAEEP